MAQRSDRDEPSLQTLQHTVWSAITTRTVPPELEAIIADDARCTVARRVEVYASMYGIRLRESLAQDFPKLRAAFGPDAFDGWMDRYVRAHPSTRPTLRDLGRHLPEFLRAHGDEVRADLAALEWARLDVFDREDDLLLTAAEVAEHAASGFAALRLQAIGAHVVVSLAPAVVPLWRAPGASPQGPLPSAPEASAAVPVLVWRKPDQHVYHRTLDDLEAACLRAIETRPAGFAELCMLAAAHLAPAEAARRMVALLSRWLDDGLLRATTD